MEVTQNKPNVAGVVAVSWGVLGVLYILGEATLRLSSIALEAMGDMGALQWAVCLSWVGFNAYAEGYRGFQKAFAPRVAARARVAWHEPTWLRVVLAPMFLMGFVDATRKRLMVSWILASCIVLLVTVVRALAQPWRGIVDAGVVVGLGWGIFAILVYLVRAAAGQLGEVDPEVGR